MARYPIAEQMAEELVRRSTVLDALSSEEGNVGAAKAFGMTNTAVQAVQEKLREALQAAFPGKAENEIAPQDMARVANKALADNGVQGNPVQAEEIAKRRNVNMETTPEKTQAPAVAAPAAPAGSIVNYDQLQERWAMGTGVWLGNGYDYTIPVPQGARAVDVEKELTDKYKLKAGEDFVVDGGHIYMTDEGKKRVNEKNHGYDIQDRNGSLASWTGFTYCDYYIEFPATTEAADKLREELKGVSQNEQSTKTESDGKTYVYLTDEGKRQLEEARAANEAKINAEKAQQAATKEAEAVRTKTEGEVHKKLEAVVEASSSDPKEREKVEKMAALMEKMAKGETLSKEEKQQMTELAKEKVVQENVQKIGEAIKPLQELNKDKIAANGESLNGFIDENKNGKTSKFDKMMENALAEGNIMGFVFALIAKAIFEGGAQGKGQEQNTPAPDSVQMSEADKEALTKKFVGNLPLTEEEFAYKGAFVIDGKTYKQTGNIQGGAHPVEVANSDGTTRWISPAEFRAGKEEYEKQQKASAAGKALADADTQTVVYDKDGNNTVAKGADRRFDAVEFQMQTPKDDLQKRTDALRDKLDTNRDGVVDRDEGAAALKKSGLEQDLDSLMGELSKLGIKVKGSVSNDLPVSPKAGVGTQEKDGPGQDR